MKIIDVDLRFYDVIHVMLRLKDARNYETI